MNQNIVFLNYLGTSLQKGKHNPLLMRSIPSLSYLISENYTMVLCECCIFEFTFDNVCKLSGAALDGIKCLLYKNMLLAVIIPSTTEWAIR